MKIYCSKCNSDISKIVDSHFDAHQVGYPICPNCKTTQKRYISESDLLLYLFFIELLYSIVTLITGYAYEYFSKYFWLVEIAFAILIGAYFFQKFISKYIYTKTPFKVTFADKAIEENSAQVRKNINIQFSLFIVLAFGSVIASSYRLELLFLLFSDVIITLLRYILSIRREIEKYK